MFVFSLVLLFVCFICCSIDFPKSFFLLPFSFLLLDYCFQSNVRHADEIHFEILTSMICDVHLSIVPLIKLHLQSQPLQLYNCCGYMKQKECLRSVHFLSLLSRYRQIITQTLDMQSSWKWMLTRKYKLNLYFYHCRNIFNNNGNTNHATQVCLLVFVRHSEQIRV